MTHAPADGPAVAATPRFSAVAQGDELFTREIPVSRATLVAYAGASGDLNPIHWNEAYARDVGLDGVIAHGMLTLGLAGAAVSDWAADPGRVVSLEARFTRPVPVPERGDALVSVRATAGPLIPAEDGEGGDVRVDLKVTGPDGSTVLGRSRAVVRLPA